MAKDGLDRATVDMCFFGHLQVLLLTYHAMSADSADSADGDRRSHGRRR